MKNKLIGITLFFTFIILALTACFYLSETTVTALSLSQKDSGAASG